MNDQRYITISYLPNMVLDTRTNLIYSEVVCKEQDAKYYTEYEVKE